MSNSQTWHDLYGVLALVRQSDRENVREGVKEYPGGLRYMSLVTLLLLSRLGCFIVLYSLSSSFSLLSYSISFFNSRFVFSCVL